MSKKHMLLMLACCLIPLSALALISVFNIPANSVLPLGMILLCPLLHLVMMRGMMGGHGHHAEHVEHLPMAQKIQQLNDQK